MTTRHEQFNKRLDRIQAQIDPRPLFDAVVFEYVDPITKQVVKRCRMMPGGGCQEVPNELTA